MLHRATEEGKGLGLRVQGQAWHDMASGMNHVKHFGVDTTWVCWKPCKALLALCAPAEVVQPAGPLQSIGSCTKARAVEKAPLLFRPSMMTCAVVSTDVLNQRNAW